MLTLLFIVFAVALIVSIAFIYYQRRKLNKTLQLLAMQNQNIMLAIRAGNIAVWGYDVKQGHLYNIEGEVFPGDQGATIAEAMSGVHPDDCDEFAKVLQGVVDGEMPSETTCIRFKNMYTGEWEYIEKEFAVIKSRSGEVETVIGTHKDVTKKVLATRQIDELLKKYQYLYKENHTILNSLPTGVAIYDKEGKLFYINQMLCNMLGAKDCDQLLGVASSLWQSPLFDQEVKVQIRKGENTVFSYQIDCSKLSETYFNPSDKMLHVSCISSFVKNEHSEVESYIFIHRDITNEYNHQLELEKSKLKTQLAVQVSDMVQWEYNVDKRIFHTLNEKSENDVLTPDDYYQVTHPDDLQKVHEIIALMDSKRSENFEFDTRFKFPSDNQWQYIKITGTPLKQENNGEITRYTGFQRNNTQWQNLTEELKESRNDALSTNQLLREILSRIPGTIFIKEVNDGFRYVMVNSQFGKIWGVSEKEVIGKTDFEIMDPELAAVYRKDDERVIAEGKPITIVEETYTNGVYQCWKTIKSCFTSINNRQLLIGMSVDITEIRKTSDELQKAKNKAEESDRLKSAFLANMSHEIRTPLNSIVGFSGLLKDSNDEKEKNEFWNIINKNNDLLLRLINDILDLSKIEAGAIELKSVKFNLAERFDDLYSTLKLRHINKEVEFICDNPYNKCIVTLDEGRITQIITNFVTNAFKFTPKGQIKMGYEFIDGKIKLYCTDTGIGIAPEKMDKIFTRFSKLDDFAQGTGLGTAICKAIVDAYGGEIGADSVVNEGSTFWAWIPCEAEIE